MPRSPYNRNQEKDNTQQQALCLALTQCPDLLPKEKWKPKGHLEAKPEAFWQRTPPLGWENVCIAWNPAQALPSPALLSGTPVFFPSVLLVPWVTFMTVCFRVLKE